MCRHQHICHFAAHTSWNTRSQSQTRSLAAWGPPAMGKAKSAAKPANTNSSCYLQVSPCMPVAHEFVAGGKQGLLLPVPAEVHMRLAAGEAAIYTLHVLCRAVLPLFRAGGRGSRVQSLHHLQSPYWVVTVDYRPIH